MDALLPPDEAHPPGNGALPPARRELTPEDEAHLARAVELGRRGWGKVHPNPLVGCVLVRDGEVVGEGWHEEYGEAHAEANALARAGKRARGATVYVSLEPCNHHGHTPPCSLALLEAGVARVVYGGADPGSVSGGGGRVLREAGVEVVGPVFTPREVRRENPAFFHVQEHATPFVALKLAQSLDGGIAEGPGLRTRITGPEAGFETHRLRSGFDAVMVGSGTALVDDPLLTVRASVPLRTQPVRVVLDRRCRLEPEAMLFRDVPDAPLLVLVGEEADEDRAGALRKAGARVRVVAGGPGGLSLEGVLETCWEEGIRSVFCEGGGTLAARLMAEGKARRLYLLVAPFVLGTEAVPAFPGLQGREVWDAWEPTVSPRLLGRDVLLTFDRRK